MKKKIRKIVDRGKQAASSSRKSKQPEIKSDVPRITNKTVAEHREDVLAGARKYIYPLQHSRHKIVIISTVLLVLVVVAFFVYTLLALYRFHSTSTFTYSITRVIPFPVAKAGPSFVSYENYLFEVRRYKHYYESQQGVDFATDSGRQQLQDFQRRALGSVINTAYIKQLADKHNLSVSRAEVDDEVALLRSQNRLGDSDQMFESVLKSFWGWSVGDFKRQLSDQLLAQKVVAKLDTEAQKKAQDVLSQLRAGADFAEVARQHSSDPSTRENGGEYGITIEKTSRDIPARVIDAMFALQPGEISDVIVTPNALEIVKVIENNDGKIRAAHITFAFKEVSTYVEPIKKEKSPSRFISP